MNPNPLALPLLDFLAHRVGSAYLSDLHWIDRARLARELEQIPAEAASLHEWNDALGYLAQAPPEATPQAARRRLLERLQPLGHIVPKGR